MNSLESFSLAETSVCKLSATFQAVKCYLCFVGHRVCISHLTLPSRAVSGTGLGVCVLLWNLIHGSRDSNFMEFPHVTRYHYSVFPRSFTNASLAGGLYEHRWRSWGLLIPCSRTNALDQEQGVCPSWVNAPFQCLPQCAGLGQVPYLSNFVIFCSSPTLLLLGLFVFALILILRATL